MSKIRVGVIYGGRSTEHSISCISAGAIISHLDPERFEVVPIGITRQGSWVAGSLDPVAGQELPSVELSDDLVPLALSINPDTAGQLFDTRDGSYFATIDVAFPVLHGPFGEDGTIQGLLEIASLPYVGPGVLASAAGMDKEYTKKLAVAAALPVTEEAVVRRGEELTEADRQRLGLPVFVKPARGGSSIGISKVDKADELDAAIAHAFEFDSKVIVESMIYGSEVEVGVLQYPDGRVVASLPAQLEGTGSSDEGFYGFDAKYLDNVVTASIPAPLPEETIELLRELAIKTFRALDCTGLARVDFFVTDNGPVFNEINTLPGFTPISMYPQMFAATGVAYPELLATLVETALASA